MVRTALQVGTGPASGSSDDLSVTTGGSTGYASLDAGYNSKGSASSAAKIATAAVRECDAHLEAVSASLATATTRRPAQESRNVVTTNAARNA